MASSAKSSSSIAASVGNSNVAAFGDAPLRIGVIGAGVMGSTHARVLMGMPGIVPVGIADPDPANRQRATDLIGCPTFATYEAMLDSGIDAVTIAAPTQAKIRIANGSSKTPTYLVQIDDAPMQKKLGFFEEFG